MDWSEHQPHMREIQVVRSWRKQTTLCIPYFLHLQSIYKTSNKLPRRLLPPKQTCSRDGSHCGAAGSGLHPGKHLHTACSRCFLHSSTRTTTLLSLFVTFVAFICVYHSLRMNVESSFPLASDNNEKFWS